jgi:hypothetical protein
MYYCTVKMLRQKGRRDHQTSLQTQRQHFSPTEEIPKETTKCLFEVRIFEKQ